MRELLAAAQRLLKPLHHRKRKKTSHAAVVFRENRP
jgi:hypothetical protein